jgi:hypothetical protein
MEADAAYAAFLQQQNKDRRSKHVAKFWSWKDLVILVQFVAQCHIRHPAHQPLPATLATENFHHQHYSEQHSQELETHSTKKSSSFP